MGLNSGTRLGPYEIASGLGAGGMGEVYRARDPRIGRDVALKVLPAAAAADADRLHRFEQEARATGQLNHPNILAVFDVGTVDGTPYVVSELLEGETLRERVGGTPLPVRKAIDYGTQIARGLAAAHEKGVVHRDLKPDNVFVTRDGRVKILDFGLAKLVAGDVLMDAETNTQGVPGTDAGRVLGTVGYMSPEQVRAQPVDHRSDIFSFGSVLYEMLSGRRAFRGASSIETMNAILKEDPPELSDSNPHLPPALERIVGHCLEKNPEERFQSARDIAFDLEQLSGTTTAGIAAHAPPRPRWRFSLAVAGVAAAVALGFVLGRRTRPAEAPSFERLTFRRELISAARIAPDGRTVVYESTGASGKPMLLAAQVGSTESRSLGQEDARLGGISSTGELAVLLRRREGGERTLAHMPLAGGAPRDTVEDVFAADWGPDGTSVAVLRWTGGGLARLEFPAGKELHTAASLSRLRVSPRGDRVAFNEHPLAGDSRGNVAVVDLEGRKTVLSRDWADLGPLAWSPDGREVFFTATRLGTDHGIHAVSLDGRERLVYKAPGSVAVHDVASDGRVLLTVRHGQPRLFGRAAGEREDRDLSWLDYPWLAHLSADGRMVLFDEGGLGGGSEYSTYLRALDGSSPVRLGPGKALALSPDGRWALVIDLRATQLVLLPTGAGRPRPLPRGSLVQVHDGIFAGDGRRVFVGGNEAGRDGRTWVQDIEGGDPRPLTAEGEIGLPSPDGKRAVLFTPEGLKLMTIGAAGEPRPIAGTLPRDDLVRFSADGRFLIVRGVRELPAPVFRVDLETGRRELLGTLGPDAAGTGIVRAVDVADDGKSYAYTYFDPVHTLYVARGLR